MIGIAGIRIESVTFSRKGEGEEQSTITSNYALISTKDTVLARQAVGGYNGMKITPSADTIGAFNKFMELYKRDVETTLGLSAD